MVITVCKKKNRGGVGGGTHKDVFYFDTHEMFHLPDAVFKHGLQEEH